MHLMSIEITREELVNFLLTDFLITGDFPVNERYIEESLDRLRQYILDAKRELTKDNKKLAGIRIHPIFQQIGIETHEDAKKKLEEIVSEMMQNE